MTIVRNQPTEKNIIIISSDSDFLQVGFPNIDIFSC